MNNFIRNKSIQLNFSFYNLAVETSRDMVKTLQLTTLICFIFFFQTQASSVNYDSLGITKKAGKTFIIHQVDEGETLFSLSRRYHVNVDDIMIENPEAEAGLKIGQKLLVPYVKAKQKIKTEGEVHVVKPSETLYSIARMYEVSVNDIKKWNGLTDNNISMGDELVIKKPEPVKSQPNGKQDENLVDYTGKKTHTVAASETLYSISRQYDVSVDDIKDWNGLSDNELSIGQVLIVGNISGDNPTTNSTMLPPSIEHQEKRDSSASSSIDVSDIKVPEVSVGASNSAAKTLENNKIVENGFAEVIDGSGETKKYLALHRSAPIGTIIQVRNEMNNQTVFVRVVGPFPNTGDNNKILIKISKKAFDRLGSVDAKFPVEISYIP